MNKITVEQLKEEIRNNNGYLFVRFTTNWCGVCKVNLPILQKVETKYASIVNFFEIDADQGKVWEEDGNKEFKVKLVPTYMLFKGNTKVWEKNNFVGEPVFEDLFSKLKK